MVPIFLAKSLLISAQEDNAMQHAERVDCVVKIDVVGEESLRRG